MDFTNEIKLKELENLREKIIRVLRGKRRKERGRGGGLVILGGLRLDCYGGEETD